MAKSKKQGGETLTFEEAYKALEQSAGDLARPELTLEEAIKTYEEGIRYYNLCDAILHDAKQKIEVYEEKDYEEC